MTKKIHVEFSILDLNKLLMREFHYKHIERRRNAKILSTRTDSLVYEIETEDSCVDFYKDKKLFDFSDYRRVSKFFDPINKKRLVKWKMNSKKK